MKLYPNLKNISPIPTAINTIPMLKNVANAAYKPEKTLETGFNKFPKYENENLINIDGRDDIIVTMPSITGKVVLFSIIKNAINDKNKDNTTEKMNILFQSRSLFSESLFDKDKVRLKFPNINKTNTIDNIRNNEKPLINPIKNKCRISL